MGSPNGASTSSPDSDRTCCFSCLKLTVSLLLIINLLLGGSVIAYGSFILMNDLIVPGSLLVSGGIILCLSSILGLGGFCTDRCNRCGLSVSAYVCSICAVGELAVGMTFLVAQKEVYEYLRANKDGFHVTDDVIDVLESLNGLLAFGFICLAFLEVFKFFSLKKLRSDLYYYNRVFPSDHSTVEALIPSDIHHRSRGGADDFHDEEGSSDIEEKRKKWSTASKQSSSDSDSKPKNGIYTSEDDFAPLDEELYTDPHWWAKSSTDVENDTTWVTEPSKKYKTTDVM